MSYIKAGPTRQQAVGSTRVHSLSMMGELDDGETISGTPTITDPASVLTISNKVVNTSALLLDEEDGSQVNVAIGKAVQCKISGVVLGTTHTVEISVTTSAGQVLVTTFDVVGVAKTT